MTDKKELAEQIAKKYLGSDNIKTLKEVVNKTQGSLYNRIIAAIIEAMGTKSESNLKAGDAWTEYIKQFSKLNEFWNNLPEVTRLWLSQQIDIFAGKYPNQVEAMGEKPESEPKDYLILYLHKEGMDKILKCGIQADNITDALKIVNDTHTAYGFFTEDNVLSVESQKCYPEKEPQQSVEAMGKPEATQDLHPDTADLVRDFSKALAEKLSANEKKYGYTNEWKTNDWEKECREHMMKHIDKGDPRDVAIYSAFMWARGWSTKVEAMGVQPGMSEAEIDEKVEARLVSMMEENSTKLLQFLLSCLARRLYTNNTSDTILSCELSIDGKRYKIVSDCELRKLLDNQEAIEPKGERNDAQEDNL